VRAAVTMDLKSAGNLIYIVGETRAELGASLYHRLHGALGNGVPASVPAAIETMRALHQAMRQGLVRSCHDCSEGGLAVAAAEMCIAGRLGMQLDLTALPRDDEVETNDVALFAESSSRFLVEVAPGDVRAFEKAMADHVRVRLGRVTEEGFLRVRGLRGKAVVECSVDDLRRAWQSAEVV
jgi:phosphoribosylformylglycinamidine (FGAM) synthase-like enzyme